MNEFSFRKADKNDMELTFNWANEEETRKNSFTGNQIGIEEHRKWFADKLSANDSRMYIFLKGANPIGLVRIDTKNNVSLISYSVDRQYRGLGYGKYMIRELEQLIQADNLLSRNLKAQVKYENLASQKIFEDLGYQSIKEKDCIEYNKAAGNKEK